MDLKQTSCVWKPCFESVVHCKYDSIRFEANKWRMGTKMYWSSNKYRFFSCQWNKLGLGGENDWTFPWGKPAETTFGHGHENMWKLLSWMFSGRTFPSGLENVEKCLLEARLLGVRLSIFETCFREGSRTNFWAWGWKCLSWCRVMTSACEGGDLPRSVYLMILVGPSGLPPAGDVSWSHGTILDTAYCLIQISLLGWGRRSCPVRRDYAWKKWSPERGKCGWRMLSDERRTSHAGAIERPRHTVHQRASGAVTKVQNKFRMRSK